MAEKMSSVLAKQERERQAAITSGMDAINAAFAQFDPSYYAGVQSNTVNYLLPQAVRQEQQASRGMASWMYGRGLQRSSAGARAKDDLAIQSAQARRSVADRAMGEANTARSNVSAQRSNLASQLIASQNPNMAATGAAQAASDLQTPNPIAPLVCIRQSVS